MLTPSRSLVVRLRNWVGDVTLSVPALRRLAAAGCQLQLVGKGWARELLAGEGWPVHTLPGTLGGRVRLLRRLKREAQARSPDGTPAPLDALCFPDSLSSALEFRLAGLRALGHAHEGRSLLLGRAVARPAGEHELVAYWRLADELLGTPAALPECIDLTVAEAHRVQARSLCRAQGITPGYVVVCPFAGGTWDQQNKSWPAFPAFVAETLPRLGRSVLVCPGPGEEEIASQHYPSARCLTGVKLGAYAALLADAALMISNDTGPGHIAAAVGAPLISVLGPSDPVRWRPWGPGVTLLGGGGCWPEAEEVLAAARAAIRPG